MAETDLSAPLLNDSKTSPGLSQSPSIFLSNSDLNSKNLKDDLAKISGYIKDLQPVMIDTPFKGSSLVMTQDEKQYVFGSREGRLGVVDRDKKQVTLDLELNQGSI